MLLKSLIFLLPFLLLINIGCKKNKAATVIKGTVVSNVEGVALNNVDIKFYIKSLNGNSYSNVFELKETVLSTPDGQYEFSFLKTSSDVNYKIDLSKSNYSSKSYLINPDDINTGEININNISLLPIGNLNFNIKSNSNTSSTDEILFTFNNLLDGGSSFSNVIFTGAPTNAVLSSAVIAEKYNVFSYVLKRNGQLFTVVDSVFVPKGTTILKEVFY